MFRTKGLTRVGMLLAGVISLAAQSDSSWAAPPIVKISGTMPNFASVGDFEITPDGRYAVFSADRELDGAEYLYSVPIGGGTIVRLSPAPQPGQRMWSLRISPDSLRVVYLARMGPQGQYELHSVPVRGPASSDVKLNGTEVPYRWGRAYQITPDSKRVVYCDEVSWDPRTVYSVSITGPAGSAIPLNPPLQSGLQIGSVWISPNSQRVVYDAGAIQSPYYQSEVFSVPILGPASASTKLNVAVPSTAEVICMGITPDNTRVILVILYRVTGNDEVWSVPIAGPASAGIRLDGGSVTGGGIGMSSPGNISKDGKTLIFSQDKTTLGQMDLYSISITGPTGSEIKLNKPLAGGTANSARFSPDDKAVLYEAFQDTTRTYDLYSVPPKGPASAGRKVNGPVMQLMGGAGYQFTPDSSLVVYWASETSSRTYELFSVPLAGPTSRAVKLNKTMVKGGTVEWFEITPWATKVVYAASQDSTVTEIYRVPITGPASRGAKISNAPVRGVNEYDFQVALDGTVVYMADQEIEGKFELYSVAEDRGDAGRAWSLYR